MTKTSLPAVEVRRVSANPHSPALCRLPLDEGHLSEGRYARALLREVATAFHLAAVLRDRGSPSGRKDYVVAFQVKGEQLSLPLDVWPALFAHNDAVDSAPSKLRLLLQLVVDADDPAAVFQTALDELRNPASTPVAA